MASLLKSIALAAGAGIAVGICATASTRRTSRLKSSTAEESAEKTGEDSLWKLEPLLDRLESIETRLGTAEIRRGAAAQPPADELTRRMEEQGTELQALRLRVGETERRAAGAVEFVENRFRQIQQDIPSLVESKLASRVTELEGRIESQVEAQVSGRIGALEQTLADQSVSIGALRDRALETDAHLQRLIAAIEKLCERTPAPSATVLPFEAHLADAAERETAVEPRVRILKENTSEVKKPRFPLARIFGMLLVLGLPRFMR